MPYKPQAEYRVPLLECLYELGGQAETAIIRAAMERKLGGQLGDRDRERLPGRGEERWWWYTMWTRLRLKHEGIFRADSMRGVWELSDVGKEYIQQHILGKRCSKTLDQPGLRAV